MAVKRASSGLLCRSAVRPQLTAKCRGPQNQVRATLLVPSCKQAWIGSAISSNVVWGIPNRGGLQAKATCRAGLVCATGSVETPDGGVKPPHFKLYHCPSRRRGVARSYLLSAGYRCALRVFPRRTSRVHFLSGKTRGPCECAQKATPAGTGMQSSSGVKSRRPSRGRIPGRRRLGTRVSRSGRGRKDNSSHP